MTTEIELDQKTEAVVQVALDAAVLPPLSPTERRQAEARIRAAVEALIDACRTHYRYLYAGQD